MRIIPIAGLASALLIGGPVLAGLASVSGTSSAPPVNETIIVKTMPDGTWPFKLKPSQRTIVAYWI